MKFTKKTLTLAFAIVIFTSLAVIDASAQRRGGSGRGYQRPIIIKQYYVRPNPFWYRSYWDDPYYYDPYLEIRRQHYYLERELHGNKEELRKHLKKYNADGVLTAKERKELADDYRDVERAQRKLNEFRRRYYSAR